MSFSPGAAAAGQRSARTTPRLSRSTWPLTDSAGIGRPQIIDYEYSKIARQNRSSNQSIDRLTIHLNFYDSY